jgi:dTDP-4-amino-4,6-dideoxygalactose transaminase
VETVVVPPELDAGHVYHLFPVRSAARTAMQAHLRDAGVETLIHYPVPIPRQPALRSADPRQCPVADRVCGEIFSLPMYPSLSDADVTAVVAAVNSLAPHSVPN